MEQPSLTSAPQKKRSALYSLYYQLGTFDRLLFICVSILLTISALTLLYRANQNLLSETPARGGVITEGIIGSPRFINPLLAITDADRDLTALIYSGLLKATNDGTLMPDLAESYAISADGLVYTFTLREDATFHDGTPVTATDVVFTIQKAQDPSLRSPRRVNWEGVVVQKIDERTVTFTLRQQYTPFLQNVTLGILPSHIWNSADIELFQFSQYNNRPIGSGPYQVVRIQNDESGIPNMYELRAFKNYTGGEPYITKMIVRFYPHENALLNAYSRREIERVNGIQPAQARLLAQAGGVVLHTPLPRVFGVFFNPVEAVVFTDATVREALELAIDRNRIIAEVLQGYGTPLTGPLPPTIDIILASTTQTTSTSTHQENIQKAQEILDRAGWEVNEEGILARKTDILSFTLSTSNIPELRSVAELIKEMLAELRVEVVIQIFEPNDLTQNIIRPRKYDALLFGEVIGRDRDLYAFWHSSQRNDPGYNIAQYTNITVDKILENIRISQDTEKEKELFTTLTNTITKDRPAIFLYAPDFIYVVDTKTKGMSLSDITIPTERFININEWYIHTERIWPFFTNK